MNKTLKLIVCLVFTMTCFPTNAQDLGSLLKKGAKEVGKKVVESAFSGNKGSKNVSVADGNYRLRVQTAIDGLSVKVKTCEEDANGNIILTFTLENQTNKDATTSGLNAIYSKANDDEGNEYKGNEYSSSPILFSKGNELNYRSFINVDLPSGIPVKYKMKIIDVDPAARILRLVTINLNGTNNWHGNINLHNIPITREGD